MPSAASRPNDRYQQIRQESQAAAQAEVDAIRGLDRSELDAALAESTVAGASVAAARKALLALTEKGDTPYPTRGSDNRYVRRLGVPLEDFEAAYVAYMDAEHASIVAGGRARSAMNALDQQRPADPAAARDAAEAAMLAHVSALPDCLREAVAHLEAIRQLGNASGIFITISGQPAFESSLFVLIDNVERAVETGIRRRTAQLAQSQSGQAPAALQHTIDAARVNPADAIADAINNKLAAVRGANGASK